MEYTLEELRRIKQERWNQACEFNLWEKIRIILGISFLFAEHLLIYDKDGIRIENYMDSEFKVFDEGRLVYDSVKWIFRDGAWRFQINKLSREAKEEIAKVIKLRREAQEAAAIKELREELGL